MGLKVILLVLLPLLLISDVHAIKGRRPSCGDTVVDLEKSKYISPGIQGLLDRSGKFFTRDEEEAVTAELDQLKIRIIKEILMTKDWESAAPREFFKQIAHGTHRNNPTLIETFQALARETKPWTDDQVLDALYLGNAKNYAKFFYDWVDTMEKTRPTELSEGIRNDIQRFRSLLGEVFQTFIRLMWKYSIGSAQFLTSRGKPTNAEDVFYVAEDATMEALQYFDRRMGYRLSTSIVGAIKLKFRMLLRPRPGSREYTSDTPESFTAAVEGNQPEPNLRISKEMWDAIDRTLNEYQRLVIHLRYPQEGGDAWTFEEIGEMVGVTKEAVRVQEKKALEKIREFFEARQISISDFESP